MSFECCSLLLLLMIEELLDICSSYCELEHLESISTRARRSEEMDVPR
jgi:hypothetical protein